MSDNLAELYAGHVATLASRHDRALSDTGLDHIAIFAGSEHMIFLDDMPYPFKPNPHFKCWLPLTRNPHCFVIYTPGSKPVLVYYQPVDYWHKPPSDPEGFWVDHFDIRVIADPAEAKTLIPSTGRTAFVGETDGAFDDWGFAEMNPGRLLDRLHFDRAWKTAYEIECMRRANVIGVRGHRAAEAAFHAGESEYGIHQEYLRACGHTEAELPYGNIIALNENGSVLHYQHQAPVRPENVHSFLIDAGASFNGYASDITRTYSSGNGEFQELIDALDAAQLRLCAAVKPGLDYPGIHLMAHHEIAGILSTLGFVDGSPESVVERKISSAFFPHGIGHYIGLQVHDVGGFAADPEGHTIPRPEGHPYLRLTRVIDENQVFTIEPGIYFIDSLLADLRSGEHSNAVHWDKVDSFRKYGGVRIEDDVVVTATGCENLTRDQFAAG